MAGRLGHRAGGLVGGLPVVAGPILLIYAVEQGETFAEEAAAGAVLGIVSLVGSAWRMRSRAEARHRHRAGSGLGRIRRRDRGFRRGAATAGGEHGPVAGCGRRRQRGACTG